MDEPRVWDGSRPLFERAVVSRRELNSGGMTVVLATEDVRSATDWCFEGSHHTFVVHLAGRLQRMESVFANGLASAVLPSVGDVWVVPPGCRYAALAQGSSVRYAEFKLPASADGHDRLVPRIAHRDAFLHQAAARVEGLAQREDDLAAMMLEALLRAVHLHLQDLHLRPDRGARATGARGEAPCFSERQRRLLAERLHDTVLPARVDELAALAGVSVSSFARRFKASFGTTPWQYLLRARLDAAQQLLQGTRLSVERVAERVGFADASHLATSFTRHVGLSPSAYRRSQAARLPEE